MSEPTIRARFQHERFDPPRADTFCGRTIRATTTAIVEEVHEVPDAPPTRVKIAMGLAHCSAGDNFDPYIGRKLALRRALIRLPIEIRRAVWAHYWTRTKPR